jgi:hypothetical protein
MPCFYTYRYFTETISNSNVEFLDKAASRLGATVSNITEGYTVGFNTGSSASIIRDGTDLKISTTDKNSLNTFMQEITAASLQSSLALQGKSVERSESKGQIRLVVTE